MKISYINNLFVGSAAIQNVKIILPPIVEAGTSATLLCLYDLEGATLYSVQWYRGQFEFFRFIPNENPPIKVFEVPGIFVEASIFLKVFYSLW